MHHSIQNLIANNFYKKKYILKHVVIDLGEKNIAYSSIPQTVTPLLRWSFQVD